MASVAIGTRDHHAPAPGRASLAHLLRDVAPRAVSLLPGIVCRAAAFDAAGAPQLYLTFDDGPTPTATPRLLSALERLGVHATHFVVGSDAARDPGVLRALADAGHAIGNHGWEHHDAWRSSRTSTNLDRGRVWLEDALGRLVPDTRPPFGRVTPAIYRWARAGGARIVLWDHMPGEFLASPPEALAARLVRSVRPGSIIVLHDGAPVDRSVSILDIAVPNLLEAGWCFPTV